MLRVFRAGQKTSKIARRRQKYFRHFLTIFMPIFRPLLGGSDLAVRRCRVVYFLSSLRGQTAKTLICAKSGVSADSRKSAKKCAKSAEDRAFCAKSVQKMHKKRGSPHFSRTFRHSFWNRRKPHFLCRLMFLPFGL